MRELDPLVEMVLARLERISVESPLAHKASGIRGAMLRIAEAQQNGIVIQDSELYMHVNAALKILEQAAISLPVRQRSRS